MNRSLMKFIGFSKVAIINLIVWNTIGLLLYDSYYSSEPETRIFLGSLGLIAIGITSVVGTYQYMIILTVIFSLFILLDQYDPEVKFHSLLLAQTMGWMFFGRYFNQALIHMEKLFDAEQNISIKDNIRG